MVIGENEHVAIEDFWDEVKSGATAVGTSAAHGLATHIGQKLAPAPAAGAPVAAPSGAGGVPMGVWVALAVVGGVGLIALLTRGGGRREVSNPRRRRRRSRRRR